MQVGFKEDVRLGPLAFANPEFINGIWRVRCCAPQLIEGVMIVTSCQDGDHVHELHYLSCAFDVRYVGLRPGGIALPAELTVEEARAYQDEAAKTWSELARWGLGPHWDVVHEPKKDHNHHEWHPKR
jgi:hypothetical protein